MATKKKQTKPAAKSYPKFSENHAPRDLSRARDLEALRRTDPLEWRERILTAVRAKEGSISDAADLLGIGRRSITRFASQDAPLNAGIEKIRELVREARSKAAE